MNALTNPITVSWQEDGSATCLARITADDGTGAETGVPGEGNWVKQADLSTITCGIYDLLSSTPGTAISTPTVTISTAIQDTPVTSQALWSEDRIGWNFKHKLASTSFPAGGRKYLVEYIFTTTGSAKWTVQYVGIASPVYGS